MDYDDLARLRATIAEAIADGMNARSDERVREHLFVALAPAVVALWHDEPVADGVAELGLPSGARWDYRTHYPILCAQRTRAFVDAFFDAMKRDNA